MSESSPTKEIIGQTLRRVIDPNSNRDVVALGYVRAIALCEGAVRVTYALPASVSNEPLQKQLRNQTVAAVSGVPGIRSVDVDFEIHAQRATNTLPGVKHVVAIGAGKGGVGKSTVAVLAAVGLQRMGFKTGLLDADVYGPSLPKLTGTEGAQPMVDDEGHILPPQRDGIPIMSMGYLVSPDQAVVWRGPMAQKYVKEFIDRGSWGELDYLFVDLPPGTGDIPLTLAQSIPLTGAVIVCTPQDVALLDAVKALRMYQKLGVEPLGMIENMSFYVCPQCGCREDIFGHGGAEEAARGLGIPFLGGVPLNIFIRRSGDAGNPFDNFTKSEPYVISALEHFCRRIVEEVDTRSRTRTPLPQLKISG